MRRALLLGRRSRAIAPPNPWVGATVVAGGEVVGEGRTSRPGGPHAEVQALRMAKERARGAALYVTLEPCVHYGRTPPCADAIIEAGIARVVVGTIDPDGRVRGKGVDRLRAAGVEVIVGWPTNQPVYDLMPYLKQRLLGRPYVVGKIAMSLDAKVTDWSQRSKWVTGAEARAASHRLRREAQAVVIGSGTLAADSPALTARRGGRLYGPQPERWVISRTGLDSVPPGFKVSAKEPDEFLLDLAEDGVISVLVEGGPSLLGSFISKGALDELAIFVAPKIFGEGLSAFRVPGWNIDLSFGRFESQRRVGKDLWIGFRTAEGVEALSEVEEWVRAQARRFA